MKPPKKGGMPPQGPSVFAILRPYRPLIIALAALSVVGNGLGLWLPKILSHAIDAYVRRELVISDVAWLFGGVSFAIFVLAYAQSIAQTYASERVARDLRNTLSAKISRQSYAAVQKADPSVLLTNLTSDMDSVKLFVAQAVVSLISSGVLIVGASGLLLLTNWKLAIAVLIIVPVIAVTFFVTLGKVREYFLKGREVVDRLNRVIGESIVGAALVRVLNVERLEKEKFSDASAAARDLGMKIVSIFAGLIPAITFIANLSTLIILGLGGHYVTAGSMTIGDFAAFTTYVAILIFPILVLGFMSNIIAQANASYGRIAKVLEAPEPKPRGAVADVIRGDIAVDGVSVVYGEKSALREVSFKVKAGSRTAIIGPTAAGKTQLLYVLAGLLDPVSGTVSVDGRHLAEYDEEALHRQIGFVFQDSIVFNSTLRENIGFGDTVSEEGLEKAIATAELADLIRVMPEGLETVISERGTNLSGGQKQRLMLARALALEPKILLLDDFTARVDAVTEGRILANLRKHYPDLTLISVTQKISSVEEYDSILLLMEGEALANGTHGELLKSSPEYMQIYTSQRSTTSYEVRAE